MKLGASEAREFFYTSGRFFLHQTIIFYLSWLRCPSEYLPAGARGIRPSTTILRHRPPGYSISLLSIPMCSFARRLSRYGVCKLLCPTAKSLTCTSRSAGGVLRRIARTLIRRRRAPRGLQGTQNRFRGRCRNQTCEPCCPLPQESVSERREQELKVVGAGRLTLISRSLVGKSLVIVK